MGISQQQAIECFASDDLIGIGMEADAIRRSLHPDGVVSYAVDDTSEMDPSLAWQLGDEGWIESRRRAHHAGIRFTAAMVFGAGESTEQRVQRLFAIRELQQETGGFIAFTPLSFRPAHGRGEFEEPTAVEYLKTLAISRMVLDNIEHIESNCAAQGLKVAQMALRFGANDAGSIGTGHSASFTEEDLRRVIRDAGFTPVERDATYRTMFLNN